MIIGIDFDGTCVEHDFPNVGKEVDGAVRVLKELIKNGHQLVLFTMRSNNKLTTDKTDCNNITLVEGNFLDDAVKWFNDRDIPLYGVNTNPTQHTWTSSPKAYCHLYIDDASLGMPLVYNKSERPFVNWNKVEFLLKELEII